MIRLANIEKAGYFPLPPSVTKLILSYISALHGGRILDPCAGEGTALVTLARSLNIEPYGVELHGGDHRQHSRRSRRCWHNMAKRIWAAFYACLTTRIRA